MATSIQHRRITSNALALVPSFPDPGHALANLYCLYPDIYASSPGDLGRFCLLPDGMPFHYLPDTPVAELYRYFVPDSPGRSVRCRPFVNHNFEEAEAGFSYCFFRAVGALRSGELAESLPYLGVLLHVLQDATFGVHVLEGPGGFDLFLPDRLGFDVASVMNQLERLDGAGLPAYRCTPDLLGNTIPEAVTRLYSAYARAVRKAREAALGILLRPQHRTESALREISFEWFGNSVHLCADVLATVLHIAQNGHYDFPPLSLTELEPYEFPVGGTSEYRFRMMKTDCFYDHAGCRRPLIFPDISFEHGISFGLAGFVQNLFYRLPGSCFHSFTGSLKPAEPDGFPQVVCRVVNDGRIEGEYLLGPNPIRVTVKSPRGVFGLSLEPSPAPCGVVILGDPVLM